MRKNSATCDIVEHPLVSSLIQFLAWKFDGNIGDIAMTFSDSTKNTGASNELIASVDIYSTIPSDMFIPGFSHFWKEQFLEFLVESEPAGLFSEEGIIGNFTVRSETEIHVIALYDDQDQEDLDSGNPNISFLPSDDEEDEEGEPDDQDPHGGEPPLNTITLTIELLAPQRLQK